MDRNSFIEQVSSRLDDLNISYKINDSADIVINEKFINDEDGKEIYFLALFLFNLEKKTVYTFEQVTMDYTQLTDRDNVSNLRIKNKKDNKLLLLGVISASVGIIARENGLKFEKVLKKEDAMYKPNEGVIPVSNNIASSPTKFCTSCGKELKVTTRFCTSCGHDTQETAKPKDHEATAPFVAPTSSQPASTLPPLRPLSPNMHESPPVAKKKKSKIPLIIGSIVLIAVLVFAGIAVKNIIDKFKGGSGGLAVSTSSPTAKPSPTASLAVTPEASKTPEDSDSSFASLGLEEVNTGNSSNSQFYFESEDYIFYVSHEPTTGQAHIYSRNKETNELKAIFDGFGWSLIAYDDWLYFTGNYGTTIDNSYNLYRMRFDGSGVQLLNDKYTGFVNIFEDKLYYIEQREDFMDTYRVKRCNLDGSGAEILSEVGLYPIVYKGHYYFTDPSGNMLRYNIDKTDPQVISGEANIKFYNFTDDYLIYIDMNKDVVKANPDGSNPLVIWENRGNHLMGLNTYGGRIYFAEYNEENFNFDYYGYYYDLISIDFDGKDERILHSGYSFGMYINVNKDGILSFEYNRGGDGNVLYTYIVQISFDGKNVRILDR